MGLSKSKSKSTTNQTTTDSATRTPTNPQWVTDAVKGYTDRVNQFGGRDPQSMVAGPSALQGQAFSQAGQLGSWLPQNQQASEMASGAGNAGANLATAEGYNAALAQAQQAQATQAGQYMGEYLTPYLNDVVDATMADFDANAGEVRAAQAAAAARNGAFGGSRYGIQEAATEGELARGRASTAAGLRADAYNFAGQMGMGDANRFADVSKYNASLGTQTNIANAGFRNDASAFGANARNQASQFNAGQQEAALGRKLQAAGLLGDLSNSAASNKRADTSLAAQLGVVQRDIAQQQALAELMQLQSQGQLLASANFGLFNGQQVNSTGTMKGTNVTTSSPNWGLALLAGASNAAQAFGGGG